MNIQGSGNGSSYTTNNNGIINNYTAGSTNLQSTDVAQESAAKLSGTSESGFITNLRKRYKEKERCMYPLFTEKYSSSQSNYFVSPELDCYDSDEHFLRSRNLPVEELFDPDTEKAERVDRVIITGVAGSGKTFLCQYIVFNWGKGITVIRALDQRIILPLFFKLRELHTECDPENEIFEFLHQCLSGGDQSFTEERTKGIIEGHGRNLILILDGFDELSKELKEKVLTFLKFSGKTYSIFKGASVLVTTRPGTDLEKLFFEKRYSFSKLSQKFEDSLISKLFERHKCKEESFRKQLEKTKDLTPLMLSLQFYIFVNEITIDSIDRDFFYEFIFCMLNRSKERENFKQSEEDIHKLLNIMGRNYLFQEYALYKHQLLQNGVTEDDVGLLIKSGVLSADSETSTERYLLIHRQFEEALAERAYRKLQNLWQECQSNQEITVFLHQIVCFKYLKKFTVNIEYCAEGSPEVIFYFHKIALTFDSTGFKFFEFLDHFPNYQMIIFTLKWICRVCPVEMAQSMTETLLNGKCVTSCLDVVKFFSEYEDENNEKEIQLCVKFHDLFDKRINEILTFTLYPILVEKQGTTALTIHYHCSRPVHYELVNNERKKVTCNSVEVGWRQDAIQEISRLCRVVLGVPSGGSVMYGREEQLKRLLTTAFLSSFLTISTSTPISHLSGKIFKTLAPYLGLSYSDQGCLKVQEYSTLFANVLHITFSVYFLLSHTLCPVCDMNTFVRRCNKIKKVMCFRAYRQLNGHVREVSVESHDTWLNWSSGVSIEIDQNNVMLTFLSAQ